LPVYFLTLPANKINMDYIVLAEEREKGGDYGKYF